MELELENSKINNQEEQKEINLDRRNKIQLSKRLKKIIVNIFKGSVQDAFDVKSKLLSDKTEMCFHPSGCVDSVIAGFLRSFIVGYSIKALISLIGLLIKGKIADPQSLLKTIFSLDNAKFGLFPGSFTFILKAILCSLRRWRQKDDSYNHFVSAAIAGFVSLYFQNVKNRSTWMIYLAARGIDAFYNHLTVLNILPRSNIPYLMVYCLTNAVIGYVYAWEIDVMPKGLFNFYKTISLGSRNDYDHFLVFNSQQVKRLMGRYPKIYE